MGRFTDFATPLGLALGIVLLTTTWTLPMARFSRGSLAIAISSVACASMYLGSASVLAQQWRSSAGFLIGQNTYASLNDPNWETITAYRLAASLPANAKVELLNFLPGFTAVPANPFQRADGCAYIKDYTKVLYRFRGAGGGNLRSGQHRLLPDRCLGPVFVDLERILAPLHSRID